MGDSACNMALSWIYAAHMTGIELTLCGPEKFHPPTDFLDSIGNPSNIKVTADPVKASAGVDYIYTDVWVSMGFEQEAAERLKIFKPYQVNSELLSNAAADVKVLHCLPAYRGKEITAEVLDGPHSVVFDQAENRLHAQKAAMTVKFSNKIRFY